MDGITFLRKIMKYRPTPVIVVSSLTPEGSEVALEALAAGAVDIMCKPGTSYSVGDMTADLAIRIKEAARHGVRHMRPPGAAASATTSPAPRPHPHHRPDPGHRRLHRRHRWPSSGSCSRLPSNAPGIVITQHMPEALHPRLRPAPRRSVPQLDVREAAERRRGAPGTALVAPGNHHLLPPALRRALPRGASTTARRSTATARRSTSCSSSVAATAGPERHRRDPDRHGRRRRDGACSPCARPGARTVAQDEASCVVYGMPKVAVEVGAAEQIVPLDRIAPEVLRLAEAGLPPLLSGAPGPRGPGAAARGTGAAAPTRGRAPASWRGRSRSAPPRPGRPGPAAAAASGSVCGRPSWLGTLAPK